MVIITTYHLHLSGSTQQRLIYAQVGKDGDKGGSGVKRIHCQRRTIGTKIAMKCSLEAARQWLRYINLMTTLRYMDNWLLFTDTMVYLPLDLKGRVI